MTSTIILKRRKVFSPPLLIYNLQDESILIYFELITRDNRLLIEWSDAPLIMSPKTEKVEIRM